MKVRILLIDDHSLLRSSLREFLLRNMPEAEVVGEASDSRDGWDAVTRLQPDLAVVDLGLPNMSGVDLTRKIRTEYPEVKVLVLTAHVEASKVNGALEAGASGYVLKRCNGNEFIAACRSVLNGQTYLSPEASTIVVHGYQRHLRGEEGEGLAPREVEALRLIANGHSTKEIAHTMAISTKTVETYRLNMMRKLKLNSVAELTKYAIKQGISTL